MSLFLAPECWPFTMAAMLLVAIAVIEGMALLAGFSFSGWLDNLVPHLVHDFDSLPDSWLGWLHIGKVPMLVILIVLLTAFSTMGYAINGIAHSLLGFYPPVWLSVLLAFFSALPVVRVFAMGVARIIPRDESSAVSLGSLVGRVAVIVNGTAQENCPAQARVRVDSGQTLYIHVEPDGTGATLATGDSVLLVKQISGSRFMAIANPRPDLL